MVGGGGGGGKQLKKQKSFKTILLLENTVNMK